MRSSATWYLHPIALLTRRDGPPADAQVAGTAACRAEEPAEPTRLYACANASLHEATRLLQEALKAFERHDHATGDDLRRQAIAKQQEAQELLSKASRSQKGE